MKIEFTLPKHNFVVRSFCNFIVASVKKDLRRSTNLHSLQIRLNFLMSIGFIQWERLPQQVSSKHFLEVVLRSIDWGKIKKRYIIQLDPKVMFPGSTTPLVLVVKALNYGGVELKGCFFISRVFQKYQENIYRFWLMYRMKIQR